MADPESPIDLSEPEEKNRFPWLILIGIIIATAALGFWISKGKARTDTALATLEQQRVTQKALLDQEREKVVTMTNDLDLLKQKIVAGKVENKEEAVKRYNDLAAAQRTQREKVKSLADEYNQIIAQIHALQ